MSSGNVVQANALVGWSCHRPPSVQWVSLATYPGWYLAYPARIRPANGSFGATSSTAEPSTMTTSAPATPDPRGDSTWIAIRGFSRRLRCQRVGPPSTYQWPSTHAPQIGIRCGAPSALAVASQYIPARSNRSTAHDQGSTPSVEVGMPYPGMRGRSTLGPPTSSTSAPRSG